MKIHLIDTSGLTTNTREPIEMVWGSGKWEPASMGGHSGEVYRADDGMNVFATTETVKENLRDALNISDRQKGTGVSEYAVTKLNL